ncbi:DUF2291 domain-containing protein [Maribrevibacterium harenarium]|uniref:DUF2291 domain-containing protein n=1 Tax=Maribrevibacterium harenarium TaxID=2589817 RepID=A0A501X395_9GAMM|nr:DUF2291 domain-containing protein [Maribrevibacterium harenarium]TPE54975.1 DUF2291 domain-containing protein [Maribrevibacterium harenarium]
MGTELSNQITQQKRKLIAMSGLAAAALVGAMVLDTKVIVNGSLEDLRQQAFSPDNYAKIHYPEIKAFVLEKAVDGQTLLSALKEDKKAAGQQYGVAGGIGPVIPVTFSGQVLDGRSGVFKIKIPGFPDNQTVRMQTGPAINGTDLRDATGKIQFGEFKNQIEYQDVGAAINRVMKADTLANLDQDNLSGQEIDVTGVFRLINAKNWLVTPVEVSVR